MPHSRYPEIMRSELSSLGLSWSNWVSVHFIALVRRPKPLGPDTGPSPPHPTLDTDGLATSLQKPLQGACPFIPPVFQVHLVSPPEHIFDLPLSVQFHDDCASYKPGSLIPCLLTLRDSAGNIALRRLSWPSNPMPDWGKSPLYYAPWTGVQTSVVTTTLLYCSVLFVSVFPIQS